MAAVGKRRKKDSNGSVLALGALIQSIPGILTVALVIVCSASAVAQSSDPEALIRQGYVAAMSRQWDDAVRLYTKALELDPSNVVARFQRAVTLEVAGRNKEAVRDYEQVIRLRPDHSLALEYLAKLYEKEGRLPNALALYKKSLSLVKDPKWRSVVRWWISNVRKKMKADGRSTRGRRALRMRPLY